MSPSTIALKENETCVVLDAQGGCEARTAGVYRRDTRYLGRYAWSAAADGLVSQVLQCDTHEDALAQCVVLKQDMTVLVRLERRLQVLRDGCLDAWTLTSHADAPVTLTLALEVEGDGRDLFAVFHEKAGALLSAGMERRHEGADLLLTRTAQDGVEIQVRVGGLPAERCWVLTLQPHGTQTVSVRVTLSATDDPSDVSHLPSYHAWRAGWHGARLGQTDDAVLHQAIDDLRLLMMSTPHGLYPAAGMPHFVTVFGRDALITSMMLLPHWPEVAAGVLRYLAAHQGREVDPFREEQPGKILHEVRRGELSRTGRVPFGRYFGSVDATPLFLLCLAAHRQATGDDALLTELSSAWRAAADWLAAHQTEGEDANSGLISFKPSGSGLMVQSWKDSSESMVHADGSRAVPPLAVAEVQGYAYAAFLNVAEFHDACGEPETAARFRARASRLAEVFHRRFWLDDLGTYAMALDGESRPLRVLSSDAGHLLWSGIVPRSHARRLVDTLMSPALWSGWGLRTLGAGEVAFNPVTYHNGSVWPHDTAIFAAGLARYGFQAELHTVAGALFDLAAHLPGLRLQELVSGHAREPGLGPVAYTHACRPQAWAAASLPFLATLTNGRFRDDRPEGNPT